MKEKDIIGAWRDEDYEDSLSEEELGRLPANPAGRVSLTEADVRSVSGGAAPACTDTRPDDGSLLIICCP